jgi:exopolysaccharide biosynthesis WecB/TagA/CpsF family protein
MTTIYLRWFLSVACWLAGLSIAAASLYLLTLTLASFAYRAPVRRVKPQHRLAVLIPAHNEAELIGRCLSSLAEQSYPPGLFRIVVIADNCSDETASIASGAGVEVMVRNQPESHGKGYALRWAMDQLLAEPTAPDAVVVVDADSRADRDLLSGLEAELSAGSEVVQGEYLVVPDALSPRSELVAAAFLLFHRVRFAGRSALGMAVNLVGNGMLFSRRCLELHPWDAFIGAEDLQFSISLRLAGIKPVFAQSARVYGPMPADRGSLTAQRQRWEGGRFFLMREQLWRLVATSVRRRDPSLLDAAIDLAVPPLGLLVMLAGSGALVTGLLVAFGPVNPSALLPWTMGLVAIPTYVGLGLRAAHSPASTYRALRRAPSFLLWKLLTYLRMTRNLDVSRWERSARPGDTAELSTRRLNIAGVPIDGVPMAEAVARLKAAIGQKRAVQVATINLDFLVKSQRNPEIREIFRHSQLNVPDGAPVVWLGRLGGHRVPERVAGVDLVRLLMEHSAETGARVFFLGGENGVALEAANRLRIEFPGLRIAGCHEPPRAAIEEMRNDEIIEQISQSNADVLLVAFGNPKQDIWIHRHRDRLPVSVAVGVGCSFDVIAGRRKRAPGWMQRGGLEWFYRLVHEPRRLLVRYLVDAGWLVAIGGRTLMERLAIEAGLRSREVA